MSAVSPLIRVICSPRALTLAFRPRDGVPFFLGSRMGISTTVRTDFLVLILDSLHKKEEVVRAKQAAKDERSRLQAEALKNSNGGSLLLEAKQRVFYSLSVCH